MTRPDNDNDNDDDNGLPPFLTEDDNMKRVDADVLPVGLVEIRMEGKRRIELVVEEHSVLPR